MDELTLPKNSWIVLDTNFLIDFYSKEDRFAIYFDKLRSKNNTIVTIDLVKTEFIRTKNKDVLEKKVNFFNKVVEDLLPLDQETLKLIQPTMEKYGNDMDGMEIVDIYLACVIQRYSTVYLLTKNHSDFPCRLFDRTYIFNV